MCGISGIVGIDNIITDPRENISNMIGVLRHRGPNASGLYLDDKAHLGHARLSIIDLDTGLQPIHNEDKTIWTIFNGEIYNYQELTIPLKNSGHKFYTSTDTEVLVHLYEDYKEKFLHKLNGQFAFAIWDTLRQELFIARDRFGKKPIYYSVVDNKLVFGSEIKALLTYPGIDKEINHKVLNQIFSIWSSLPGETIFKNIFEIPAGCYLTLKNGNLKIIQYWDVNFATKEESLTNSKDEIIERISDLLHDSVKLRLRADVPVGCYLSGGLDSSGITSIVKNEFDNFVQSFGIRFSEKKYDEGTYQNEVADFLKVFHSEVLADNNSISDSLENVIWHTETPITRLSPVPLYLLSKFVNKIGLRVILTGEGADEVFAGYNIFKETLVRYHWGRDPNSLLKPKIFKKLYPYIFNESNNSQLLTSFFKQGINDVNNPLFSHLIRWQNTSRIKMFLNDDISQAYSQQELYEDILKLLPENFNRLDPLSKAQYLEMKLFLSNYLLSSQGDRVAMANSVEVRMPFLDYRLVELMSRVPFYYKLRGLQEKFLLKKVLKDKLPANIVQRQKFPYRSPINEVLLNNRGWVDELLGDDKINKYGIFKSHLVNKLVAKQRNKNHQANEVESMALSAIITTQLLIKTFFEEKRYLSAEPARFNLIYDNRRCNKENDYEYQNKKVVNR